MEKLITWFEIPVADLDRARSFYEKLFGMSMTAFGTDMWVFPYDPQTATGGAVFRNAGVAPSANGTVVYMSAEGKLDDLVARVASLGGKVLQPKTHISPEIGYIAHIADSEGNRVGLHSHK